MGQETRKLLEILRNGGVEFVLVGGWAAILHGSARTTLDLDVVYRRNKENIAKLSAALQSISPYLRGAPPGLPFQWDERTIKNGLNFTLTTSLGDIDFLGEIAGAGMYEDVLKSAIEMELFEGKYRVISLDGLIAAKRAAGRPKDLEVIAELELLHREHRGKQ
jgi:predicted nucleotidyltransferase